MAMIKSTITSRDDPTEVSDVPQASSAPATQRPSIKTESVPPDLRETDGALPFPVPSLPAFVIKDSTTLTLQGDNTLHSAVDLISDIEKEVENEGLLERNNNALEVTKPEISENHVCPVCSKHFVGLELFIQHLESQDCLKSETVDVVTTHLHINSNEEQNLNVEQNVEQNVSLQDSANVPLDVDNSLYLQVMNELVHAYLNPIDEALKESNLTEPQNQDVLERQRMHASLTSRTSGISKFQGPIKQTGPHSSVFENLQPGIAGCNGTGQSSSEQDKLLKCPHCPYTTSWSTNLATHIRTHNGDKPFKCSLCSYACTTKQRLAHHVRIHLCEKPNKLLEHSTTVRQGPVQEQKTHDAEEQSFKCLLCSQTFSTKESLVQHQISHISTTETSFECPNCSFATTSKASLVRHLRLHTGEKPFKCSLCPYAGSQHQRLIEHQRTHSGEKPYKCSQCSFSATTKKGVTRHMKTHTGEKPFKCSLCSFASSQRASLNRHFRRHTGEKPYKCSLCPYAASELKILVCHQRTHTGEKPYKCSLCSYASTKQCNLIRHMGTHSGERVTMVDNSQQFH